MKKLNPATGALDEQPVKVQSITQADSDASDNDTVVFVQTTFSIGTPEIDNWQLDTGPSVAVVALLVYLALRLRTYWIVAVTAVSMGGEAAILPNLAGREHLVAISLGFLTYFVLDVWGPAWRRRHAPG